MEDAFGKLKYYLLELSEWLAG